MMRKKILASALVQKILVLVGIFYLWLVLKTQRWTQRGTELLKDYVDHKRPVLVCFWHNRLFLGPKGWAFKAPFYMLISKNRDGRLISGIVSAFGIKTIAGSSSRGGSDAFQEMVALLKQGCQVGVTPDGPRGPREQITPGIVQAAYATGADILPVTFWATHHKIFSSWDRFMLPFPFGKALTFFGEPVKAPTTKEDIPLVMAALQKRMDVLTQEAEEWGRHAA